MTGHWVDLGRMEYNACHTLQDALLEQVADGAMPPTLLFVEHPPVLTLGASFHESNLLFKPEEYENKGISVVKTDRGGDVTYHGPGQLVAYPIFDVAKHGRDLHKWLRDLEEAVIVALAESELKGERFPPNTGVWVGGRKVCAIGIKVRRWVNKHGIALNCDNDLQPFELIVPCGIKEHGVTSISKELGQKVSIHEARRAVRGAFESVFDLQLEEMLPAELGTRLNLEPAR